MNTPNAIQKILFKEMNFENDDSVSFEEGGKLKVSASESPKFQTFSATREKIDTSKALKATYFLIRDFKQDLIESLGFINEISDDTIFEILEPDKLSEDFLASSLDKISELTVET